MRLLILFQFVALTHFFAIAQTKSESQTDTLSRPVVLVFSGSDWCQPCIRFEKQVLQDSVFLNYAAAHLTVVKADFPQRKKLPPDQRLENERLAVQYNPDGKFPHIVLLRPDRSFWAVLPGSSESGPAFIAQIKKYLPL